MLTEFATIQFTREELKELQQALLQRAMVEDELRRERGQEKADRHALLEKIEALLGESQEKLRIFDQAAEDELWEFAWYAFTDEWAWYRAAQEVDGEERTAALDEAVRKSKVEQRYREKFDKYVAEVDMLEVKVKDQKSKVCAKGASASGGKSQK